MMRNACTGSCKIYFPNDSSIYYCPKCGKSLSSLQDNKQFKACSYDRNTNTVTPLESQAVSSPKRQAKIKRSDSKPVNNHDPSVPVHSPSPSRSSSAAAATPKKERQPVHEENSDNQPAVLKYTGRISSYTHDEMSQSFTDRMSLFFRGLHSGTTRYTVTFLNEADSRTYQVVYYGAYRPTSPTPVPGDLISVDAQPKGNLFVTENVYLGEGGGRRIKMSSNHRDQNGRGSRRSNSLSTVVIIAIAVIGIGYLFLPQISGIINIYISILFALFLIWLFVRPMQRLFRTPSWMFGISALLTAAVYNIGGIGTVLSSLISPLMTIGFSIAIIYYIFRL